ncbi:hypothetical protein DPX16_4863 [Anabarilius grahami]|uniref:Uncharacterized protein n=1 Tax=Anabarilius grahami TaxID=495550 RepID=A0A3N0Y1G2_ANAGA|nr:hypothetical protein DPX16_4863 [Anabarilius grahami]
MTVAHTNVELFRTLARLALTLHANRALAHLFQVMESVTTFFGYEWNECESSPARDPAPLRWKQENRD